MSPHMPVFSPRWGMVDPPQEWVRYCCTLVLLIRMLFFFPSLLASPTADLILEEPCAPLFYCFTPHPWLMAQVDGLLTMFPDVNPELVRRDLAMTRSLDLTANNILTNRVLFVDEVAADLAADLADGTSPFAAHQHEHQAAVEQWYREAPAHEHSEPAGLPVEQGENSTAYTGSPTWHTAAASADPWSPAQASQAAAAQSPPPFDPAANDPGNSSVQTPVVTPAAAVTGVTQENSSSSSSSSSMPQPSLTSTTQPVRTPSTSDAALSQSMPLQAGSTPMDSRTRRALLAEAAERRRLQTAGSVEQQ
jgi:hypothetical protein